MDLRLVGRRVLVTGGASGIGAATARALRAEGAVVAVLDRQVGQADPGGSDASCPVALAADVTREDEVAAAVAAAASHLGGLDGVVCSAGVSGPVGEPLSRVTAADVERVLAVNLTGALLTVKHAEPHLAQGRDPAVVLVSSDSALTAAPGMAAYCASKGGVLALGRALSVDLRPAGIRVNSLCPSVVDTPMSRSDLGLDGGFDDAGYPVHSADDVARLALLLLSPVSRSVNGTHLLSDFGLSAASPFPA